MATFIERLEVLVDEICQEFHQVIAWNGQPSDNYSETCLKIADYGYSGSMGLYTELLFLDRQWVLTNDDGYQFHISCMEMEQLADLADKISIVNPYCADAKIFPLLDYDGDTDLSDFPNFSADGSVSGMKARFYGKGAMLLRHGGYIYNVTSEPEIYLEVYDPDNEYDNPEYQ